MILWNLTTVILLILAVREVVKTVPSFHRVLTYPTWTGFTFLWFTLSITLYLIK